MTEAQLQKMLIDVIAQSQSLKQNSEDIFTESKKTPKGLVEVKLRVKRYGYSKPADRKFDWFVDGKPSTRVAILEMFGGAE